MSTITKAISLAGLFLQSTGASCGGYIGEELQTACQQSCPAGAIVFGNINDPNSKVAKRKKEERDYAVLGDLNYRPRTTYTAGVINPNLELA